MTATSDKRDWFDPSSWPDPSGRARRIEDWLERYIVLWEGSYAGERLALHSWQRSIIRAIYGPCDDEGKRLVRRACIWLPRGNAKTALGAGLALVHFVGPERVAGGQVYIAAADREQASIAFKNASTFCQQVTDMQKLVRTRESRKEMFKPSDSSVLKALSSEGHRHQGKAASFVLMDEVHAWKPSGRDMYVALDESMKKRGPRERPLTLVISTAGEGEGGLAWELWQRSLDAASSPESDPSFVSMIFAAATDSDWQDEGVWRRANPGLRSGMISLDGMRDAARQAARSPAMVRAFKRYNLNQWSTSSSADAWIDAKSYDASAGPQKTLDELEGEPCWIGIDLGAVDDTTAVAVCFREPIPTGDGWILHLHCQHFVPGDWLERRQDRDRADYFAARDESVLTATPGPTIDYRSVAEFVGSLKARFQIETVAVDPWRADLLATAFEELEIDATLHPQTMRKLALPTLQARNAILEGRLRHGGQRLLRQHFLNAASDTDRAGNERLVKAVSTGKIDGAVASVMAIGLATEQPSELTADQIIDIWTTQQGAVAS